MTAARSYLSSPAQVDPRELTTAELQALRLVQSQRLHRCRNGWRGIGKAVVTLKMADRLMSRHLVARQIINSHWRIQLTGIGRNTLAVADSRRHAS